LEPLERRLIELVEEPRRAEEERASRDQLRVIQRAFRGALLALPAEEQDCLYLFYPMPGAKGDRRPAIVLQQILTAETILREMQVH
jgi:hypothetical protein